MFWSLECPLHTGLTVFSYVYDIDIIYLYLHYSYIKNNMYKTIFKWDVISKNLPDIIRKNDGYQSECYKKYAAYNTSAYITEEEVESKVSLRSSTTPCLSKSSGVFEPVYLFCNKK